MTEYDTPSLYVLRTNTPPEFVDLLRCYHAQTFQTTLLAPRLEENGSWHGSLSFATNGGKGILT